MTFADAFDVNVPSELPQEATLHQYAAGGFRDLRRGRSQPVWRHTAPDSYQSQPHLYHPADPRALHAACHVHRRPPDVVLRFRGADHTRNDGTVSNAWQQAVTSVSGGESIKTHLVLARLLFFFRPPYQLAAESCFPCRRWCASAFPAWTERRGPARWRGASCPRVPGRQEEGQEWEEKRKEGREKGQIKNRRWRKEREKNSKRAEMEVKGRNSSMVEGQ